MCECLICERINLIKKGLNPFFIMELETGYVVFGDYQYYKGYTLLLYKDHEVKLHLLDSKVKKKFLNEMSIVGEAVNKVFQPQKLNYELLGNKDDHLHWHIFPRHTNDPLPTKPTWSFPRDKRCNEKSRTSNEFADYYKKKLASEIKMLINNQ